MAIVPLLFSQLSSLLLIAIIGYAAVKKGIMKASECKPISTLLIYVIIPSSIIKALQLPLSEEKSMVLALPSFLPLQSIFSGWFSPPS